MNSENSIFYRGLLTSIFWHGGVSAAYTTIELNRPTNKKIKKKKTVSKINCIQYSYSPPIPAACSTD